MMLKMRVLPILLFAVSQAGAMEFNSLQSMGPDGVKKTAEKIIVAEPSAPANISKPDAHVVTLYDGIDTTTLTNNKIIATLPASMPANLYELNVCLSKGLVVAVSASYAGDYTVFHRAG